MSAPLTFVKSRGKREELDKRMIAGVTGSGTGARGGIFSCSVQRTTPDLPGPHPLPEAQVRLVPHTDYQDPNVADVYGAQGDLLMTAIPGQDASLWLCVAESAPERFGARWKKVQLV